MFNSNAKTTSPLAIWAGMLSIYVVWGSTYLAIQFAVETIPPFLMAATRNFTAGVILYTWRRLAGDPRPSLLHWRSAAIIGLLLLTGGNGLVSWAEQLVPSGVTSLLVGSVPLWIMLVDLVSGYYRQGGSRPGVLAVMGLVAGFGGIALLVGPGQLSGTGQVNLIGAGALLLGSLLWALGSVYNRGAKLPASPLLGTGMEMLAGGLGLFVVGTLAGEWPEVNLAGISSSSLFGLLYLIFFGSLVGFASYTWLLRVAPITLVSTYAYVNPVVALFLGALIASEVITGRMIIAALIILGSVALITITRTKRPVSPPVVVKEAAS
ncbi:MAG: EamA family transporter [Chloroflexota bacterium]